MVESFDELFYRAIAVPTLLLVGEHDGCIEPALFNEIRRADERHHVSLGLKGSGHFLHHDNPDDVARLIGGFLHKLDS